MRILWAHCLRFPREDCPNRDSARQIAEGLDQRNRGGPKKCGICSGKQHEAYFTRARRFLNSGVPALASHSNTTISLSTMSAPALSIRARASLQLASSREETASATT